MPAGIFTCSEAHLLYYIIFSVLFFGWARNNYSMFDKSRGIQSGIFYLLEGFAHWVSIKQNSREFINSRGDVGAAKMRLSILCVAIIFTSAIYKSSVIRLRSHPNEHIHNPGHQPGDTALHDYDCYCFQSRIHFSLNSGNGCNAWGI